MQILYEKQSRLPEIKTKQFPPKINSLRNTNPIKKLQKFRQLNGRNNKKNGRNLQQKPVDLSCHHVNLKPETYQINSREYTLF